MKYIDAEKLITEIERRKEQNITWRERNILVDIEMIIASLRAEMIITSLQQEQQDNEDIDKVAQELYEHLYELKRRNNVPTNLYDKQEIIDLWKEGIEYGRNHPKQEQPECIYGRTPEEREKCCKFCSAICEARIEQEQPEVDLEKEIEWEWIHREKQEVDFIECAEMDKEEFAIFARHFYKLGLNATKEQ